ncbi:serine/threonine-protein phosphatase 6 regulatory ankyrin repeat subunit A [Aplysia californica]|uniref:Serine/threonine-protein phosphatase 6 regulatory ankyrin repeat subunit A n=1 Tax=Aplysia californica TaxID=6500 RepID=A0ABM0JAG2_APLCA|nr:serine/threonine-protein phosphatase 6 regulatory ankyrin repeat subunit A [Aplysia californica]
MEKIALPPPPSKRLVKTALHQAVLDERLHQVRLLVDKHGVGIDTKDVHGRTPLMLSCIIDNHELGYRMAYILLKAGAYLNLRDGMGRTALSYACMNGRESCVAVLLKEDVLDINEPDNDGNTPLHHASTCGNPRIVDMLAKAFHKFGLNADKRNNLGYTALLLACKSGHYVSAHLLLTVAKASPALRDGEFHLNATEWAQRSHQIQARLTDRSFLASAPAATPRPLAALSFEREDSMYQRPWVPICRLYRVPNPHFSADNFKLPDILLPPPGIRSELFLDGLDARQILLNEIELSESKTRPVSTKATLSKWSHPPTAKLRNISQRNAPSSASVPDMVTMFKMYCEQYQPDWRTMNKQRRKTMAVGGQGMTSNNSNHSFSDIAGAAHGEGVEMPS